jgi:predicted Ser/Thr protein kinase
MSGFRVLAELGQGSASKVYLAEQEGTGRQVALKVVTCAEGVAAERLAREARILASLDHSGLVRVYAAGSEGPLCWLAMELVAGGTLEERLQAGPLSWSVAREIWLEVAQALAYLHESGVVHRDVKPANILLDGKGRAKLADFGLARTSEDARLTSHGGTLGTPLFMAPEQVQSSTHVGPSADVFSMGCVLYALLTGKSPFFAEHVAAVLQKVLHAPVPPLPVGAEVPAGLESLLSEVMAKDARRRPRDARALLHLFADFESGTRRRRKRWLRRAVAASLMALGGLAFLAWPEEEVAPHVQRTAPSVAESPPEVAVPAPWPAEGASLEAWIAAVEDPARSHADAEGVARARERIVGEALEVLRQRGNDSTEPNAVALVPAGWPAWLRENARITAYVSARTGEVLRAKQHQEDSDFATRREALWALVKAQQGGFFTRATAAETCEQALDAVWQASVPERLRSAFARETERAVDELVRTGEARWADGVRRIEDDLAAGRLRSAIAGVDALSGARVLPGAMEALKRLQQQAEAEDARRIQAMEDARMGLVQVLASRRSAPEISSGLAMMRAAFESRALEPLDAEREAVSFANADLLLRAVETASDLLRAARDAAARWVGQRVPLHLCGEWPRGERVLFAIEGEMLLFSRADGSTPTRVLLEQLDASTLLWLADLAHLEQGALVRLLHRLQRGDFIGVALSCVEAHPTCAELLNAHEGVRRRQAGTSAEQQAWDALANVRAAAGTQAWSEAEVALSRVHAIRERVAPPVPAGWRDIHAEEAQWKKTLGPVFEAQAFAAAEGWRVQREVETGTLTLLPTATLHAGAARVDGGDLVVPAGMNAGHGLNLALPAGAWDLSWELADDVPMFVGECGLNAFVVVLSESEPSARGLPLHGLERGLMLQRRVNKALSFQGSARVWPEFWNSARKFAPEPGARWHLALDSKGQASLTQGTSILDVGFLSRERRLTLYAPVPLSLRKLRLDLRER